MKHACTGLAAFALVLSAMAVPEDRFLGGPFDGSSVSLLIQFDPAAVQSFNSVRFRGGDFDGGAIGRLAAYDRASAGAWISDRFRGGQGDGYAMTDRNSYDREASPQWNSIRFTGGPRDGSDFAFVTGIPNPLNGDLDSDGLPDWWEALYYSSIFVTGPDDDTDYDGMSAWGEYVSGTVPTNDISVFQCLEIFTPQNSNGWKVLRWSSMPGRTYSVYAASDLTDSESWMLITNLPATPPDNVWTNASNDQLFDIYGVEVNW